jgi:AcrR family transcriptional regulator
MVGDAPLDARTQAVRAATRLFAAHGFDATSLQAVADAVGVTKQAVLHHFASKERLRQAVLETMLAHWNEALPRLLLAATASDERFDAVFGETRRFFTADPDRARLVLRELLDRPKELREVLRGPVKPWIGAVAGYIRAGQEGGRHFSDVDAEAYVLEVMLLVITAAASQSVLSAAVEGKGAEARLDAELARIARASLFRPTEPQRKRKGDEPWPASSPTTRTSSSASRKPSTGRRSPA